MYNLLRFLVGEETDIAQTNMMYDMNRRYDT